MEGERVEGVYNGGCIQEAFRGFLKCLGLESGGGGGGGGGVAVEDEIVVADNPPPPQPPLDLPTTYESLPSVEQSSTVDPLVEVLSSPTDSTTITTRDMTNNNVGDESNSSTTLVSIDEIFNNGSEANFVELIQGNNTFITASLISSGGGGKTHSATII